MDFISLAQSETSLRHNFIRHLQATSTTNTNNNNNEYDSVLKLSPTAESELFMLCTNFLLYVAMVIVGILVCKIYFPELLVPRPPNENDAPAIRTRSVSYKRVVSKRQQSTTSDVSNSSSIMEMEDEIVDEDENYYASDDDDNNNEEETSSSSSEHIGDLRQPLNTNVDENGSVIIDASDEDMEYLENDEGICKNSRKSMLLKSPVVRSASNLTVFDEFDQEKLSKTQVMKRLIFCALMLNITFVIWGILQERMLTRRYPRGTGEYFTYSYALVFTNRCWTMLFSGFLMFFYLKPNVSKTTIIYEYSFPSISNMLSSWCQYEALRYVSFPAATLFKAFKLAPVMTMGKILGNKIYPTYDYVVALFIGIGITMFMSSTEHLNFNTFFATDIYGDDLNEEEKLYNNGISLKWTGIMLLIFFLLFDSFTSQWQSRMFQRHRDLSMIELMFATSACSTILSLITLIHTKELYDFINFLQRHTEIHLHFFLFSICSTIGQLFIFYTIKNFGAVIFTIIMTIRILISIAVSVLTYGHDITGVGFIGLCLVICSVLYRIKRKSEGKQLIKWSGMLSHSTKEYDLVHMWHEHGDM